jgi:DNA polymerase-3 subunit beta
LELRRLLEEESTGDCELGFAENSALFKKPGLTMVMRLIDGAFPDYQRVIPKESDRKLVVNRQKLADALKRISLLSSDKSSAVRLALSDGLLRVAASNPDLGEAKDDLDVHYQGPPLTVGFNARYFLDVIGVIDGDDVRIELGDEHSPAVIHPAEDAAYTAVIMPMRV